MSSNSTPIVLKVNKTPEVIALLHAEVAKAVAATADELAAVYSATAPKDTGFMASSAYIVTHEESTYLRDISGSGPILPEIAKPENDQTAYAGVAAEYAAFVELGTHKQAAQPAFYPAADKVRPRFEARLAALEAVLKANIPGE